MTGIIVQCFNDSRHLLLITKNTPMNRPYSITSSEEVLPTNKELQRLLAERSMLCSSVLWPFPHTIRQEHRNLLPFIRIAAMQDPTLLTGIRGRFSLLILANVNRAEAEG
jgi:hypothetical protein